MERLGAELQGLYTNIQRLFTTFIFTWYDENATQESVRNTSPEQRHSLFVHERWNRAVK